MAGILFVMQAVRFRDDTFRVNLLEILLDTRYVLRSADTGGQGLAQLVG